MVVFLPRSSKTFYNSFSTNDEPVDHKTPFLRHEGEYIHQGARWNTYCCQPVKLERQTGWEKMSVLSAEADNESNFFSFWYVFRQISYLSHVIKKL